MGRILTICGGLASVPHLSGHSVGKIPMAECAWGLGPGSSRGSFTHRSGFRGVVPWRLCPAVRLTREPIHGLSVWLGFLPVWQLCLEGDIQRSSVPGDPGEAAWHFLTLLQKAHSITSAIFYELMNSQVPLTKNYSLCQSDFRALYTCIRWYWWRNPQNIFHVWGQKIVYSV